MSFTFLFDAKSVSKHGNICNFIISLPSFSSVLSTSINLHFVVLVHYVLQIAKCVGLVELK